MYRNSGTTFIKERIIPASSGKSTRRRYCGILSCISGLFSRATAVIKENAVINFLRIFKERDSRLLFLTPQGEMMVAAILPEVVTGKLSIKGIAAVAFHLADKVAVIDEIPAFQPYGAATGGAGENAVCRSVNGLLYAVF